MANVVTQMFASTAISSLNLVSTNAKSKLPQSIEHNTSSSVTNGSSSDFSVYPKPNSVHFERRIVVWGLAGAILGMNVGNENAWAAKRAPAGPVGEKKDPNVSGVLAKVLASKKRKEAMKEAMAKQREKGKKLIDQ